MITLAFPLSIWSQSGDVSAHKVRPRSLSDREKPGGILSFGLQRLRVTTCWLVIDPAKAFEKNKKPNELVTCAVQRNRSGSPGDSLSHLSSEGYLTSGRGASCGAPNLPQPPERSRTKTETDRIAFLQTLLRFGCLAQVLAAHICAKAAVAP